MKALIWKEWREHGKWVAVPILLILVPMSVLGVPSLLDTQYLGYVSMVQGLFGAMLGFLQVLVEARGDKRALLLHRPLSRSRLFGAKVVAGVSLYALGFGVPFACAVGLAALPGHVDEPFAWPMTLPWLADGFTGLVCYFAGMLTAQREARWYGSRCLGLAAGYASWLAAWTLPEFSQALVVILLLGAVVAVAAWGSFLSGGVHAAQPALARVALALTFLIGLSAVSMTAKLWLGAWFLTKSDYWHELDQHGQVLGVHYEDGVLQSVTDLAGRVPAELQGKRLDQYELQRVAAPWARGLTPPMRSYRNKNQFFIECDNASRPGSQKWWYVPAQGRLLGYDKHSHRCLGSIGPDGFAAPEESTGTRFTGELAHFSRIFYSKAGPYLAFPRAVYAVDYRTPAIRPLFIPPVGEQVLWASRWEDEKRKLALAVIGTDQAIHFLHESGAPIFSMPRACDRSRYQVTSVGRLEDPERYWVWYEPAWYLLLHELETMPAVVTTFERTGREVLPRQSVPPRPGGARNMVPKLPLVEPSTALAAFAPITAPVESVTLLTAARLLEAGVRANHDAQTPIVLPLLYTATQNYLPGVRWDWRAQTGLVSVYAALTLVSAMCCGLTCFWLGRRYAFSRGQCVGWGLVGFGFGWTGLVLMLSIQEWPVRVICPQCHQRRVVARATCEHCGAQHCAPAHDGTEVFESPADAAQATPALFW